MRAQAETYRTGIVSNVRLKSNAGFYVGSIEFSGGECDPYDRDSGYYPTEDWLKKEYPESISMKEAVERAFKRNMIPKSWLECDFK